MYSSSTPRQRARFFYTNLLQKLTYFAFVTKGSFFFINKLVTEYCNWTVCIFIFLLLKIILFYNKQSKNEDLKKIGNSVKWNVFQKLYYVMYKQIYNRKKLLFYYISGYNSMIKKVFWLDSKCLNEVNLPRFIFWS